MSKHSKSLRHLTASALLLAITLVLKTLFSFQIPLFGENGMSVSVSGIFSMMPSFLFGPWYGAAVSGLSDLLGYLLKPSGAYMPLLTLTAALGGFLRGALYRLFKRRKDKSLRLIVLAVSALLLAIGAYAVLSLRADGVDAAYYARVAPDAADSSGMHAVSRLVIERTKGLKNPAGSISSYLISLTWGPLCAGAVGLVLLAVDLFAARLSNERQVGVLAMLLSTAVSGVAVTTLNTVILRETLYASWKLLPFAVLWAPRIMEELTVGSVKVCVIVLLMKSLGKLPGLKPD